MDGNHFDVAPARRVFDSDRIDQMKTGDTNNRITMMMEMMMMAKSEQSASRVHSQTTATLPDDSVDKVSSSGGWGPGGGARGVAGLA